MPTCTALFVDKLAFTLELRDAEAHDRVSEWFLSDQQHFRNYEVSSVRGARFYWHAKKIVFDEGRDSSVLIEFGPRNGRRNSVSGSDIADPESEPDIDSLEARGDRRPMRIEFNPTKLGEVPEHLTDFRSLLDEWFGSALSSEIYSANITRIDFAVDVLNLNINQVAVRRSDSTVVSTAYGRDGSIQTLYLGAKNTGLRFVIYDKRAQRRGRVTSGRYAQAVTRFEARLKGSYQLSDLRSLENPFNSLLIREAISLEVNGHHNNLHYWEWFVAASKHDGLEATLNKIKNPKTRAMWRRKILERADPNWWNPSEIWSNLNNALDNVDIFPREVRLHRFRN